MVNSLRGSKNFHDGQWQAWLNKDMEIVIDLEKSTPVSKITVGSLESQGPGIYFPTKIEVFISEDGKKYIEVGSLTRPYAPNADSELKDFIFDFTKQDTRYVKTKATNLKTAPNGSGTWLFVDEILIE